MKTVIINKPNDLQIIEMDKPVITEHDNVLIKMKAAGICGSDVHIYHGQNAAATYPRVIGHEMVGEVVEVGSNATKIKAGDRVIVDQVVNCGECYACRKGRGNVCANLKVRGVHIHGGYREYIAVPESDVYILPDNLSYEDAVMIEPATIAVQSCSRAELTKEDTLLILGCGALGSSILKIARLSGATIIVVDVVDEKIEEAKKNGATYGINLLKEDVVARARELTGGYGPTVSIDAACTKDSLATLLELTGNAGRVITMGFSIEPTAVTQFKITAKELDVRGSRLQNKKFQEVLNLVAEGKLDLTNSISHKFNFLDAQKAFDFVDSRDPSIRKIVLTFDN
ncbi:MULTISPECIES: zinc-binding alcohol dehydrogenase family protein [Clostridium]|uniref:Zn-dependent alcohol dehydrogenase n=2 Tax=Clostridium TaxID=1485 RepID=A0A1S9N2I9_CLOBE|nr:MULTISPECIES: zinc-binding alcohol dehydrogenase family protein [Clostridium]MBN7573718.1 zinc-binding alcohol dehydrogenase family protein [Clostridium beijerinckii]MBN7578868.1 zinc-binding alcohol dehydrogenase family protein [Clostridium beijerinckii]MBN7583349.1 zinc-binding alcohol dehydrogenase family protein [Clostridium beijerinckii]MBO0522109.1 zinc-binding alcohol dehydrogenase family protein [Clostridium beijerinckii]MZK53752.1 alcohol dehydrogenase catalytic domain-containing p